MRTLWLASAASLFIAGAACAQTSQTGPAPTGAPNAASMTNPGQSPGSTAPAPTGAMMAAPSAAPAANASGAASGPTVTTPGSSPGKTEMSGSGMSSPGTSSSGMSSSMSTSGMSSSGGMGMKKPMHHHMGMGAMTMPADATATEYLHMAKGAIKHHNKMMADDALSHAETRMLDRSVPQGMIAADSDPAVSSIESARKAVASGDMKSANADIDMAMQQSGGMASGGMSSDSGMSSGGMSPMMAPAGPVRKPMAHSIYGASNSGMAPAAGDTSDAGAGSTGMATGNATKPASSP